MIRFMIIVKLFIEKV